jgi:hypothetical protein
MIKLISEGHITAIERKAINAILKSQNIESERSFLVGRKNYILEPKGMSPTGSVFLQVIIGEWQSNDYGKKERRTRKHLLEVKA